MKFVRKHFVRSTIAPDVAVSYVMKLIYEFWGFCVNGSNDLRNPGSGSFASISPLSVPVGFESGSLLASGSDGITQVATQFFSSSVAPFSLSHVGKHLVTWKSGSESTDDSIYEIVQFINSGVIRVNTFQGGTPLLGANNSPWFTTRTSVNYRVIDFASTAGLAWVSGSFMVLQCPGASEVNAGQRTPQFRIGKIGPPATPNALRLTLSPSGSWNGTAFTDGDEFKGTAGSDEWGVLNPSPGFINLTGDRAFLLMLMQGRLTDGSVGWFNRSGIYVEVPQRLYPQVNDPNPFCACIFAAGIVTNGGLTTTKSNSSGVSRFHMFQHNGVLSSWLTMLKCYSGLSWEVPPFTSSTSYMGNVDPSHLSVGFNPHTGKFWLSSAWLCQVNATQFCLSRVRVRNLAFGPDTLPNGSIIGSGSTGGWIKLTDHVFAPWDGARLPGPYLD